MNAITDQQARMLERRLVERESQLNADIEASRALARQRSAQFSHDVIDRKADATDEAAVEVEQAETERDIAELSAIQAARLRLAEGRYGVCADCQEPIGLQRLLAQPAALRCAACQATLEERRKHPR